MRIKDYRQALLAHFGIMSLNELRTNEQWKELAKKHGLTSLRTRSDWELAYNAILAVDQENVSAEESTSSIIDSCLDEESLPSSKKEIQAVNIEDIDQATLHEMHNQEGNLVGALLDYSPEQSKKLIDHFKHLKLHSPQPWHQGSLNSAVVDQIGVSSALVATGLQAGQLFRVVGPPELVSKVASGAYQMLQTGGGSLGTVTNGSKIVGQLRFIPGGAGSALPVLAPIAVYQLLHAVVGTQQLNQINQRLAKIEHTLQELHVRTEATILGEIHGAAETLDDILDSRMNTGDFSPDAIARLASVEKTVRSILSRNKILVNRFGEKTQEVKSRRGKQGARSATELLKSDGAQAVHDMQCLVGLIAAELKLEQALLLLAMQTNPSDVGRRQERIRSKMQGHHEIIESLPSVKEVEKHAEACIRAMKWWERLFDFGQIQKEVGYLEKMNLTDVQLEQGQLESGLSGYVFWKDEEGTHVFSMSGEDLKLIEQT